MPPHKTKWFVWGHASEATHKWLISYLSYSVTAVFQSAVGLRGFAYQMWKYSSYSSGVGARRAWSISPRLMPIQVSIRSSVKTSPAVRKS